MIASNYELDPQHWAEIHFGELDLGDLRPNERVIKIGRAMAAKPGASLPQLFSKPYDLKAAYNLFSHPAATPDELQARHRELVLEALQEPGTYLLPEDTTEVAWIGRQPIARLGPFGGSKEGKIGFLLHTTPICRLARGRPIAQWRRSSARAPSWGLPINSIRCGSRSRKGKSAVRACNASGSRNCGNRVAIAWATNRSMKRCVGCASVIGGADIYEALRSFEECGHGYVVRAAQDRSLLDEEGKPSGTLFGVARTQASLGGFELELRGRAGKPARRVELQVSAVEVCIRAPYRPGYGRGKLPPIYCTAVRVREENPPPGEEALEWICAIASAPPLSWRANAPPNIRPVGCAKNFIRAPQNRSAGRSLAVGDERGADGRHGDQERRGVAAAGAARTRAARAGGPSRASRLE